MTTTAFSDVKLNMKRLLSGGFLNHTTWGRQARRKGFVWYLLMLISNIGRDKSVADDFNERDIVSSRIALLLRSAEIKPIVLQIWSFEVLPNAAIKGHPPDCKLTPDLDLFCFYVWCVCWHRLEAKKKPPQHLSFSLSLVIVNGPYSVSKSHSNRVLDFNFCFL